MLRSNESHSELLIRPGGNDHQVVADLLAPGNTAGVGSRNRPLISRLVVDAHIASRRPAFSQIAGGAGIPYLVDPITPLLQGELRPDDRWAALPFGQSRAMEASDFEAQTARDDLIAKTVDFQVEAGATAVIPPYVYASDTDDPWFHLSLDFLTRTASYMATTGVRLPIFAVMCGQLHGFALERVWSAGLDEFLQSALKVEAVSIGLCLSPAGSGKDSYHKVLRLFLAAHRAASAGVPVIAWRQGIYGPALVAAGLAGYETGIGISEQTNIAASIWSRRPKADGRRRSGGAIPGVFLEPLGRSVPAPVARALLGDLRIRAKIMCDDETCCPLGPASTLDHSREHAIRSRARGLQQLDEMPQRTWRLHRVAREARGAATLIDQSNKTLRDLGYDRRLDATGASSLAAVAEHLTESPLESVR